jgi:hypothetical protein
MKKLLLSFILVTSAAFTAFSQCTVSWPTGTNVVNTPTGFLWGQSFQATCSGNINYVQYISNATGTSGGGTLNIYSGNTVTTTPIYTQAFSAIVITTVGNPIRIMVTGVVPVVSGNTYTFEFHCDNVNILGDFSAGYTNGQAFQDGVAIPAADITFDVDIISGSGINELSSTKMSIFPNPVVNVLTLETVDQIESVMIYDINGSLVKTINDNKSTVEVSELNEGMYFLTVMTNKGIVRSRFIKY